MTGLKTSLTSMVAIALFSIVSLAQNADTVGGGSGDVIPDQYTESIATGLVPCKFTVWSDLDPGYRAYVIDSDAEAFLIGQGKQVIEDGRSHYYIYLTYTYDSVESAPREFLLGTIVTNTPHYVEHNKQVSIRVMRAYDRVTVYNASISGKPSLSKKKQLIDGLAKIAFTCSAN